MPLFPQHPNESGLVTQIRAAIGDTPMPPDAIVVRGYLGSPTDVLRQANRILAAYQIDNQIDVAAHEAANHQAAGPPADAPWRIYLSARLDRWVEIDNWEECVLRVDPDNNTDRRDSWIVWLRRHALQDEAPIRYRIVTIGRLGDDDDFVSGRLIEDYMTREASNNVVWDEQQYGPTTGKLSNKYCF